MLIVRRSAGTGPAAAGAQPGAVHLNGARCASGRSRGRPDVRGRARPMGALGADWMVIGDQPQQELGHDISTEPES